MRNKAKYAQWRVHSAGMRAKLGISAKWCQWTGPSRPAGVECRGIPQVERMLDVLDCAWAARIKAHPHRSISELRKDFFAAPSQSVARRPWSTGISTLVSNSILYSFELDSLISGHDLHLLHGFPHRDSHQHFSSAQMTQLIGESFFLPNCATVAYAFYLNPHAPWWRDPPALA